VSGSAFTAARRWLVIGRVQGVGFRWFVQRRADALGLQGWVRNLPDGRVEVVAEGTEAAMAALDAALRAGPRLASVQRVEISDYQHEVNIAKSFNIR
jgi:acylphosphatase